MTVVRAAPVASFGDDETESDGNCFEDEDLDEVPNSFVDASSIKLRARGPSGDSNDSQKLNNKKMRTRKINDTPQSVKANFLALPLNVMNEVFEHLHPSDLLRLARTSKKLRFQLMSKRLMNVWKKAREAVRPMIPECPKDQSEPQWAELLFTRECFMCGTSQDTKLNLNLRLRGCEPCLQTNLISAETARQAYPNVDNLGDVLKLIPYTSHLDHIPSKLDGRIISTTRQEIPSLFYSAHIEKMVEIWTGYKLRIEYGMQGAYNEFAEFQERRQIEVKEQLGSAEELKVRTEEMEHQLIEERREATVTKLVELNHHPRDAQNAVAKGSSQHRGVFEVPAVLSDADWETVELVMEPIVEEERPETMLERRDILYDRKCIARSRYTTFRQSYDASPDNLLPDGSVFLDIPIIKEAIESDGDDVQPSMFDSAFDKLSDYIDQWRRERRVDLARMLIEAREAPNSMLNKVERDPTIAEKEGILLLATSVFACCNPRGEQQDRSLHWFETVGAHLNRYPHVSDEGSPTHRALKCVQVASQWSAYIRALVQAAGLNPDTATQRDMDDRDARFYCKNCSAQRWDVRLARSWRNCVLHLGYHGAQHIKLKGYEPLSAEARADIQARETALSAWNAIDWSQVAISSQGVAVNLQGSVVELKAPPSRPQAITSKSNAAASTSNAAARKSKAAARKSKAAASKSKASTSKSKAATSKSNEGPSKSNSSATKPNSAASKSKAVASKTESQDMAVDGLRCKLCPNSDRQFATLVGLMAHAKVKHGVKDFRRGDVLLV